MSDLGLIVVVSAILALLVRSFWRRIVETGALVMLFALFVGVLTIITEGRMAFYEA